MFECMLSVLTVTMLQVRALASKVGYHMAPNLGKYVA